MKNEMQINEIANVSQERDILAQTERMLDFFEEYPNVGFSVCSALAVCAIMGMVVYGDKMSS